MTLVLMQMLINNNIYIYKRIAGSRQNADYTSETIPKCLEDIKNEFLPQCKTSKKYNIPTTTIINKVKMHLLYW